MLIKTLSQNFRNGLQASSDKQKVQSKLKLLSEKRSDAEFSKYKKRHTSSQPYCFHIRKLLLGPPGYFRHILLLVFIDFYD